MLSEISHQLITTLTTLHHNGNVLVIASHLVCNPSTLRRDFIVLPLKLSRVLLCLGTGGAWDRSRFRLRTGSISATTDRDTPELVQGGMRHASRNAPVTTAESNQTFLTRICIRHGSRKILDHKLFPCSWMPIITVYCLPL